LKKGSQTQIASCAKLGPTKQRWSRSRSGLRKESTIFAEAGTGVGFFNENRTRSWSENFSFYRSGI